MFKHLDNLHNITTRFSRLLLTLCAGAILVMMIAVVIQVIASRMGLTTIVAFEASWPLFGSAITLNSLSDFQWYLLAAVALLPAGTVWLRDRHVRVDFAYCRLRTHGKAVVDLGGLIVFALPFLLLIIPYAWEATLQSLARGEKSPNGGLIDRYLVRSMLPLGLGLLLLAMVWEASQLLRNWSKDNG